MPDVTWTISGATIIVVVGWIITGAFQTFGLGVRLQKMLSRIDRADEQVAKLKEEIVALERKDDAQSTANAMAVGLYRDQLAEFREAVATRFATKDELAGVERRSVASTDKIEKKLDGISNQVAALGTNIFAAIRADRSQHER